MSQASSGTGRQASVTAGRKGFKAELDRLRDRMRSLGFSYDEIAAEVGRRYRLRPREAYRLAWGWTPGTGGGPVQRPCRRGTTRTRRPARA